MPNSRANCDGIEGEAFCLTIARSIPFPGVPPRLALTSGLEKGENTRKMYTYNNNNNNMAAPHTSSKFSLVIASGCGFLISDNRSLPSMRPRKQYMNHQARPSRGPLLDKASTGTLDCRYQSRYKRNELFSSKRHRLEAAEPLK